MSREVTEAHFLHERSGLEPVLRPPVKYPTALAWVPKRETLVVATRAGELLGVDPVLGTKVITEGIGEDIIPANIDFGIIDRFIKVTDKDGAILTRDLAKMEGLFVGYSAGSAIKGVLEMADELTEEDVVVVLLHDHGSRYVGKVFNDDWMKAQGWL